MKAVILAAGYGTRLHRDLQSNSTGKFKCLIGTPKPLIPVGGCPLISHWIEALNSSDCVDAIFVVTNELYFKHFEEWGQQFPGVIIINDGTRCNEERLGAVACLQLAIKHFTTEDHVLVIGGDTLFKEDFSLSRFLDVFFDLQRKCDECNLVLSYQCKDEETSKYGILEVDSEMKVCCMKEKPSPADTNSRRACPCCYLFSKKTLPLLEKFLEEKKTVPIEERDAPGNFLSWLIQRKPVYIHEISGRFDVGNLQSYIECDAYFQKTLKNTKTYLK
ncbi:uncharacterized protein [Lepisosteus oculatus]|uniref:Zgc:136439 n=1 Tax=Lepisosteus oculatus TaxID=7918 RepID=W5MQK2_LEPOC|nr:PREDICTED: mannose-1-phosphate guanyltransferase-like [Lepisosteus oculatus]XP_015214685.1 PREDICTED: mannose-1-phosphate guanyltransferase-like [Lepisosteus oculatus]XP_015214686.1 PREDICTED: mannose-1-phosphate guanyltransferase-like [Lepisosteus oculatus]